MKIQGKKIEGHNIEICPIPRPDGDIIFRCQAVINMDDFEKICPLPVAPFKVLKGGKRAEDLENPRYKAQIIEYNKKRTAYMIIKSLEATEGLEWETVDLSDSSTWDNYKKEFEESGFSEIEVMRIINAVMSANCLNETVIEEAKQRFFLIQQEKENGQVSQQGEPLSTQFGEPVSG